MLQGSWSRARLRASESVGALGEILADPEPEERRLIAGYLESKRLLAEAIQVYAVERYTDPGPFKEAQRLLEHAMSSNFATVPAKYRRVRGFGTVHALLLSYLVRRVGEEVSAEELRILTRDAVHTERRARELRTLGFRLDAYESAGTPVYVLADAVPDVTSGAAQVIARNVREDKTLTEHERGELLREVGS